MPNYRNKNKNRKSKNRNKHNNQNQNQNKNQQQQQQQQSEDENQQQHQKQLDGLNVQDGAIHGELHENLQISGNISKPAADECISVGYNTDASTSTAATHNESKTSNDAIRHSPIVEQNNHTATNKHPNTGTTATRTSHATIVSNNDTIPQEEPFTQHSDLLSSEDLITKINSATTEGTTKNMGVNNTKMLHTNETDSTTTNNSSGTNNEASKTTTTKVQQAKVIIHRIVQEPNLDVNVAEKVQQTQPNISSSQQKAKVIIHRIKLEEDVDGTYKQEVQQYKVESPKTIENVGNEKFSTEINKDLQILELSDTGSISDTNDSQLLSPLISEVESETEASTSVNESNTQILTIQTLPLSSVISVEEIGIDKSVSSSPTQDDAKQRRAQKRAALDNHFLPQLLSPRYLDSILEENSDMSDARSDCSDKPMSMHASLTDEQAHDVIKTKKANAVFPKSNLDFSRKHKHGTLPKIQLSPGAIREEPIAIVVETKLIDQTPTSEECCARLSSTLAPASEAAEVVYINSASSSMSDLMDLDVEDGTLQPSLSNIDLDTDAKEIISKPIELTNETAEAIGAVEVVEEDETTGTSDSRESTPVNQSTEISNELATSENSSKSNSNNLSITNQTIISKTLNYDNEEEQYKLIDELVRSANAVLSSGSVETMHTISDSERSEDVQSFDTNINSSDTESLPSSTNSDSFRLRADRTSSSAFVAIPSPLSSSSLSPSSSSLYSLPSHDLHLKNSEMNNVRDIINNQMQNEEELKYFPNKHETINNFGLSGSKVSTDASSNDNDIPYRSQVSHVFLENQKSEKISRDDSPPPIPPPPSGLHNYENATTMHGSLTNTTTIQHHITTPTQTPHELPHTPANTKLSLTSLSRQASADSHYSDSTNNSQCTAINVGLTTPQSDIDLPSSPFSDIASESTICGDFKIDSNEKPVKKLRFLCAETLASMPYGEEVLEELASVAQNIGEVSVANKTNKMPYPLPDLPHINDLQLSINKNVNPTTRIVTIKQLSTQQNDDSSIPTPPSVSTGSSNTKNAWLGLPTDKNPNLLVCLSPSQRSYISEQQTKTIETQKADDLLDAHQKFIDRRGYHEYSAEQVKTMNNEKLNEQQILETAAVMKKLRKSLTPTPPPIPPPPVPTKSSDTAAKAQSQKKIANEYAFGQGHDASLLSSHRDVNKHTTKTITTTETETKTKTASVLANPPFTSSNENKNMNDDEEENKHRLLAIIHDSNDLKQSATKPKTSSFENNSRQPAKSAENKQGEPLQQTKQAHTERQSHTQTYNTSTGAVTEQKEHIVKSTATTTADMFPATKISATPFPTSNINISTGMDSDFKSMFPSMGESSFYDADRKRFSNIETSNRSPFCSQLLSTQPKRFSNIETSSYESKKCIENGKVVYDYTNSNRESHTDGEPNAKLHDIIQDAPPRSAASEDIKNVGVRETRNDEHKNKTAETHNIEIMSELNLNTKNTVDTTTTAKPAHTLNSSATQSTRGEQERREILKNRQQNENNYNNSDNNNISGGTYDVFRQHAKAAADTTTHPIAPFTAPATSNGGHEKLFDHEKLFKDFDDLSKQLHMELETGKSQKVQREKSTSLYDLNRMQMHAPYGRELENWKKQRHEHMKELEREIEKSMKSRQFRSFVQAPRTEQQLLTRTYDIPIHLEHGSNHNNAFTNNHMYEVSTPAETPSTISTPRTPYSGEQQRIYDIPIQLEPAITPEQHSYDYVDNSRFRRAESMFNLTDNMQPAYRQRADSMSYNNDDWSRYASDLGSSENIARPFAREVEICYQRSKPRTIRAPRLSVSTNDLSSNTQSYDSYNAYNVRRTHAPMLNQVPQKSRPQYLSCHSMIERNPNPTYISTTSRRGVSPAPPITPPTHVEQHYHVPEAEMRQRRASLPREIQEQQLKYIQSKEDELKTEFDRLQSERRRLMDEMNRVPQVPQRQQRDYYRPVPKLPTLSEDEVFRQQMAEEWLNKVAEREERRLQKIIKISKLNEETSGQQIPIQLNSTKPDISQEFLSRVKERRSKLAMPADSDWESGAESQPVGVGNVSETEELPTVKVLDGKIEADLNHLPRHLREFAKFSNHQKEQIDGGEREIHQEEEHRKEANNNAMSSATKKSSIVKTIKISRQPGTTGVIGGSRGSGAAVRNIPIAQEYFDERDLLSPTPISVPITSPTTTVTTATAIPNLLSAIPKSPIYTKLPVSFGEMFATSPFRSRIYEEFNNYWRSFDKN